MKKTAIITLSLGCFLLAGIVANISTVSASSAKADWEADWEMTLKKAREEGEVVVNGGSPVSALKGSAELLKNKFGINLLTTVGRSSSMARKIMEERRNGLYLHDVILTGHTSMLNPLNPSGAFDPLEPVLVLPEVVDQKLWYEGKFSWADAGRNIFNYGFYPSHMVAINTDLVKPGEIKSYYDLLNPKWKNRIIINDPSTAGMGSAGFISMVYYKLVTQDFFRQLVAQQNIMTRDQNLQNDWLARGKYPILLWPSLGRLVKYVKKKAPVTVLHDIKEGTHGGSAGCALSLMNKAPHPNAAKVFINWYLSREGQANMQKKLRRQTRRIDVSSEELRIYEKRIPGTKYFQKKNEQEDFILKEYKNYQKLAKQIFGPLAK